MIGSNSKIKNIAGKGNNFVVEYKGQSLNLEEIFGDLGGLFYKKNIKANMLKVNKSFSDSDVSAVLKLYLDSYSVFYMKKHGYMSDDEMSIIGSRGTLYSVHNLVYRGKGIEGARAILNKNERDLLGKTRIPDSLKVIFNAAIRFSFDKLISGSSELCHVCGGKKSGAKCPNCGNKIR